MVTPLDDPPMSAWAMSVLYANIVLYSVCFMMTQPVLPYLTKQLGASMAQFASFQSIFNGAQAIGGLLSGPAMDLLGGKKMFLISFAASALCYAMTASATTLSALYLSRFPTLLQHAVLAARSLVTSASSDADRARHLGYVGMCVGVGMTSGPFIGGLLSDVSLQFSAWIATAGSVLSFVTVLFLIPNQEGRLRKVHGRSGAGEESEDRHVSGGWLGMKHFIEVLRAPKVVSIFVFKAVTSLAISLFSSMITVVLQHQGLGPKWSGAALSLVGLTNIATQAFIVGPVIRRLGESATLRLSCWSLLAGFLLLACGKGTLVTVASLIPQCVGGSLISAVGTAKLTKAVPKARTGTALAIDMALWSAVRMAAPGMGASLLSSAGGAGTVGAASAALVAALMGAMHLGVVEY